MADFEAQMMPGGLEGSHRRPQARTYPAHRCAVRSVVTRAQMSAGTPASGARRSPAGTPRLSSLVKCRALYIVRSAHTIDVREPARRSATYERHEPRQHGANEGRRLAWTRVGVGWTYVADIGQVEQLPNEGQLTQEGEDDGEEVPACALQSANFGAEI